MTISAQQLLQMKEKVKKLDEQRIRAEANYDQALIRLKELGYSSIEDAEDALHDMQKSITQEEAQLAEEMDKLLDKYPGLR